LIKFYRHCLSKSDIKESLSYNIKACQNEYLLSREREGERERKLLNEIPGLKAHTIVRDLLLIFEKDIGSKIALACD
jgi:hypothetical protein